MNMVRIQLPLTALVLFIITFFCTSCGEVKTKVAIKNLTDDLQMSSPRFVEISVNYEIVLPGERSEYKKVPIGSHELTYSIDSVGGDTPVAIVKSVEILATCESGSQTIYYFESGDFAPVCDE